MGNDDYGELDLNRLLFKRSEESKRKNADMARRLKDPVTRDAALAELDEKIAGMVTRKSSFKDDIDAKDPKGRHFIESPTPEWKDMMDEYKRNKKNGKT